MPGSGSCTSVVQPYRIVIVASLCSMRSVFPILFDCAVYVCHVDKWLPHEMFHPNKLVPYEMYDLNKLVPYDICHLNKLVNVLVSYAPAGV